MEKYRQRVIDDRRFQKRFYNLASRLGYDGERWYNKTNVSGLYMKDPDREIPLRFTVLREDVKRPQDVHILWDSSWNTQNKSAMRNIHWQVGIEVYSLLIIEESIEDSLTILIQPEGERATRMHVSPMKDNYRKILDYAESVNNTRNFQIFKQPIPKHLLGTHDEDDKSKVKIKKEETE